MRRGLFVLACLALLALATLLAGASSASAAEACPNEAIREEQHSTYLPDCRAYEQVSPTDKSGGIGGVFPLGELTLSVEQFGRPLQSSADGGSITYGGEDFLEPQLGSLNQYLSTRTTDGWLTQNLTPAVKRGEIATEANSNVGAFSADLGMGVVSAKSRLAEDAPEGYVDLYIHRGASFEPLITTATPLHRTPFTFGYVKLPNHTIGDGPLFAGANSGAPAAAPFTRILFEVNDALTLDAVDGGLEENNLYEWAQGQLRLVNVLPDGEAAPNASFGVNFGDSYSGNLPSLDHVISADGSRVFWTDETNGNLYLRENADRPQSAIEAGRCTERQMACTVEVSSGGVYQTASADGSLAFFTKEGHLYRFDAESEEAADLTPGGGVNGILGASEDATSVYFVSGAELAQGAAGGQPNLYLSSGGETTFIATLAPTDDETPNLYGTNTVYGDWFRTFAGRTARVSPNGRYLAFISRRSLTSYDNTLVGSSGSCTENYPSCAYEVFLYDSVTHQLACASCNLDGSRPTASTLLPPPVNGIYQQRYLDDAGQLFFSTKEAVLPEDVNKESDVYEFEGGDVQLISPADSEDEAVFAEASKSGSDIFFTTSQSLVREDGDRIIDLYDARVGGGFPNAGSPPCEGEACREPVPQPPTSQSPGSGSFAGFGNPQPPHRHRKRHQPHKRRGHRRAGHNRGGSR
jgi:hypothetical protein